jgi:hypothetical protein
MLWDNTDKPVRVAAGERLFVGGSAMWTPGVSTARSMALPVTCKSFASFVPEQGHTYLLSLARAARWCHIVVTDLATGAPPASYLEPAELAPKCRN